MSLRIPLTDVDFGASEHAFTLFHPQRARAAPRSEENCIEETITIHEKYASHSYKPLLQPLPYTPPQFLHTANYDVQ